jgi:alpha-amylase
MSNVVFYFHVHQPYRIKAYDLFTIGDSTNYFETNNQRLDNRKIFHKVAKKCYLPTNKLLLHLLNSIEDFHISFSLSGVFLEQAEEYLPEVIDSFKALVNTGKVELVNETYYHSLSYLYSKEEFLDQIALHAQKLNDLFNYQPTAFRNTELIYDNYVAKEAEALGFKVILAEGVDRYMGWRSPNFVYRPTGTEKIKLLLKNYKLSDDIAFRFTDRQWKEWPLTADKFARWISETNGNGDVVNLFMDYETFGEHQWAASGIFDFLHDLPYKLKQHPDNSFMTVTQAATSYPVRDEIDMPHLTSWADMERDLSAWVANPLQQQALNSLFAMHDDVKASQDKQLLEDWRRLTTSDHFYYMCTKWFSDGDVHKYFSPNETPYEAYVHFMNVLHDVKQRVYAIKRRPAHDYLYP